jgi:hypothetical protein
MQKLQKKRKRMLQEVYVSKANSSKTTKMNYFEEIA